MKTYELRPIYDKAKSFYGKAYVCIDKQGSIYLYSYSTLICRLDTNNYLAITAFWDYSATTLRHFKEFLKQNGLFCGSKTELKKFYEL